MSDRRRTVLASAAVASLALVGLWLRGKGRALRREGAAEAERDQRDREDRLDAEAMYAFEVAYGRHDPRMITDAQLARLGARATRGYKDADFSWLHADGAVKRFVFTMGGDGLKVFVTKPLITAMRELGWEDKWIRAKLESGATFRLGIFPISASERATWDGVVRTVERSYPVAISSKVAPHRAALGERTFESIEAEARRGGGEGGAAFLGEEAGSSYYDINEAARGGASADPRFMSEERIAASSGSLPQVRGFLYNCLGLSLLFNGDGWTKTGDGQRGVKEYLVKNVPVGNIPGAGHRYLPMEVSLADLEEG
jgi:hypothetical protein